MIQGQPSGNPNNGDLQAVGPLGIDVQAATGFDISGVNNAAFAAVTLAGATTSELHTINLTSGAATRVNAIGGGERVRGLALNANPRATLLGVTTDNRLVTFKTTSPGTLDTNVAVTGLQGGETIIGIDRASGERPALCSHGCRPPLHARCDHGRGDDGRNAERRRRRRDESVRDAQRHGVRRGLQSDGRPAARRQRRGAEPARERRHRRDDDRCDAESCAHSP